MNAAASSLAPATAPTPIRFLDNGDGTVTDAAAGLQWSKETLTPECVKHADAEKACSELALGGFTDWRLPTVEELFLLADRTRTDPAIDVEAFPDTQSDWYWTSTIYASSSDCAWIVGFHYGDAYDGRRGYSFGLARAVRSVAPGQ